MAHRHNSGLALKFFKKFCRMNGANRYMKVSLVVFQEKQLVKASRLEFVSLPIADQTAMWETEDCKTKLKKYHVQCCVMSLNFYLHTFVFNNFSVFNTPYLHK